MRFGIRPMHLQISNENLYKQNNQTTGNGTLIKSDER
jgi:hypothetical protein